MKFSELIKKLIAIKDVTGDASVGDITIKGIGNGLTVKHDASGGSINMYSNLDGKVEIITSEWKVLEELPTPPVTSVNLSGSLIPNDIICEGK